MVRPLIEVSIADQQMRFSSADFCCTYTIGTALNGAGEDMGSGKRRAVGTVLLRLSVRMRH